MTPVMAAPAFLKNPFSIATPYGAPDGSALYCVTRMSSAAAGAAAADKAQTQSIKAVTEFPCCDIVSLPFSDGERPLVCLIVAPGGPYYRPPTVERKCGRSFRFVAH
jgi:hypothetical protein